MGMDQTIILGAFIKTRIQYKEVKHKFTTCVKHTDKRTMKFCNECGTELTHQEFIKKYPLTCYDLFEENERLIDHFEGDFMYIYSNERDLGTTLDIEAAEVTELTDLVISKCKDKFLSEYIAEIKTIEEKLKVKVKVSFGFIEYWS